MPTDPSHSQPSVCGSAEHPTGGARSAPETLTDGDAATGASASNARRITEEAFFRLARRNFDFLVREHGFASNDRVDVFPCNVRCANVCYELPSLRISVTWTSREGPVIDLEARLDTAWIRPASAHNFGFREFLRLIGPEAVSGLPEISTAESESEYDGWLAYNAEQLRIHGGLLLKGDLAPCEDILITRYCNSSKGLPMDEYFRVFREECAGLPPTALAELEAAMAARSPRQVFFLLQPWVIETRVPRSPRLINSLNDFWRQYFL